MGKQVHHMGMILDKADHDEFHKRAPELNPRQHDALMKRMGITPEEDEAWHETHLTLGEQRAQGLKHIDPGAIGIAFSEFCIQQGWMVHKGKDYFATREGIRELRSRFDISL